MPNYTGILSIIGSQSYLDGAVDGLLVMEGYSDVGTGSIAATQFLVRIKHLQSGQFIGVDGKHGSVGTVSIIVFRDAWPAGGDAERMEAVAAVAVAVKKRKPAAKKKPAAKESTKAETRKKTSRK